MRDTRERRTTPRTVSILATLALVGALLSMLSGAASAAPKKTCRVENTTLGKRYAPSTGASLQPAIDEAVSGYTLEIQGRCVGVFTISDTTLTLIGVATRRDPVASLDGNGVDGTVVTVSSGSTVTFTDLAITGANCTMGCLGGGISNLGTVTLNGSTQVSGSTSTGGGGIYNGPSGTIILEDSSSVSGNTAGSAGGGIFNRGTVILNDSSSVSQNTAGTVGGGIVNDSTGTVTMNDSSSVSENIAAANGGGVFNLGSITLNDSSVVRANRAGGSGGSDGRGGGILTGAGGTVTLNDSSSVSGNTATSDGGGLFNNDGIITLNGSSSVSGNTAGLRGGGIFILAGPHTMNGSSVVSGNTAPTCPDVYPCGSPDA